MALGETAQLLVELNLTGDFNSGMQVASARVAGFSQAATGATANAETFASRLSGGVGNALSTFKGRLEGAAKGIALFAGVGGLLSLGGAIKSGLEKAQALGDEVRQLTAITGLSATSMSVLAGTLEHYGVNADSATRLTGFLEKNVGLLAAKKDGLVKFQQEFGLALTDTNGKIKDANALILTTVDYFNNKSIPATEKAAALSKLYGRSWQELIPFLQAGRAGIADTQAELVKYGLTLSGPDIISLQKFKDAQRELGTAVGGLELQIGLKLVPTLTKFATGLTSFIANNGPQIEKFFGDLGDFVSNAAGTIAGTAQTITGFWNMLPKPFRDILVTGIVGDRAIKFLFGFDPLKVTGSLLGKGFDLFASRGSSPANPVFVSGGIGGGGGPGGPPGAPGEPSAPESFLKTVIKNAATVTGLGIMSAAVNLIGTNRVLGTLKENALGQLAPGQTSLQDSPFLRIIAEQRRINGTETPQSRALLGSGSTVSWVGPISERIIDARIAITAALNRNLEPLPSKISAAQRANFNELRDRIEASRIATQTGTSTTTRAIDTENAAVVRAIHAQKLAVSLHLTNATTVSVTDVAGAIHTKSIYSTGVKGALIGMIG